MSKKKKQLTRGALQHKHDRATKRVKVSLSSTIILLLILASVGLVQASVFGGAVLDGASERGCDCHTSEASPDIIYSIEGIPKEYEPGTEYNLSIQVFKIDTSEDHDHDSEKKGFSLGVSLGELVVPADSLDVQIIDSGEITHTQAGTARSNWSVIWKAPAKEEGNTVFHLSVMVVNGDGINGEGDHWQNAQFVSLGKGGEAPAKQELGVPLSAHTLGIIGLLVTIGVVAASYWVVKAAHETP